MEYLPDELIVHIFQMVDDTVILSARKWSKYYHGIVHPRFIQICESKPILKSEIVAAVKLLNTDSYRLGYLSRLDSTKPIKFYYMFAINAHNILDYEYYTRTYLANYGGISSTAYKPIIIYKNETRYDTNTYAESNTWLTNVHTLNSAPFNSAVYDVDLKTQLEILKSRKNYLEFLGDPQIQIIRKLDSILGIYETALSNFDGALILRIHGYLEMNMRVHLVRNEFVLNTCVHNFNPEDSFWKHICAEIKLFYQKLKEIYQT